MISHLLGSALLLFGFAGCFLLCRELAGRRLIDRDWRLSWILAGVLWGSLLTWTVELCSLAHRLTATTLAVAWALLGAAVTGAAIWLARRRGACPAADLAELRSALNEDWGRSWPTDAKLMSLGTVVLAVGLFVIAGTTPTTNWDSLTYHLPRVMHWIQQQSVEHYPTGNIRQLEFGPWSAFALLNLLLLTGDDQYTNLMQWLAMITSLIAATMIAGRLLDAVARRSSIETAEALRQPPVRHRVSALTCLLMVTLPAGVVEATTTQTDYTAACWCLCSVVIALSLLREPKNVWYVLAAGLSLGVGVLTKATTYIYLRAVRGGAGTGLAAACVRPPATGWFCRAGGRRVPPDQHTSPVAKLRAVWFAAWIRRHRLRRAQQI